MARSLVQLPVGSLSTG